MEHAGEKGEQPSVGVEGEAYGSQAAAASKQLCSKSREEPSRETLRSNTSDTISKVGFLATTFQDTTMRKRGEQGEPPAGKLDGNVCIVAHAVCKFTVRSPALNIAA